MSAHIVRSTPPDARDGATNDELAGTVQHSALEYAILSCLSAPYDSLRRSSCVHQVLEVIG